MAPRLTAGSNLTYDVGHVGHAGVCSLTLAEMLHIHVLRPAPIQVIASFVFGERLESKRAQARRRALVKSLSASEPTDRPDSRETVKCQNT